MSILFADSFYFIALLNPDDAAHRKAGAFSLHRCSLMTTEWVLVELADAFGSTRYRAAAAKLIAALVSDPNVEVRRSERSLFDRGLDLYAGRADKEWSLTDCISFEVMREEGLTEALTADHHFEQAGFKPLLK